MRIATRVHRIELGPLPPDPQEVRVDGIPQAVGSYTLSAFLDVPPEEVDRADETDPRYLGEFAMFGIGAPLSVDQAAQRFSARFALEPAHRAMLRRAGGHALVLVERPAVEPRAEEFALDDVSVR